MAVNPLIYPIHVKRQPDYTYARSEARRMRDAGVSYNLSLRLKHSESMQLSSTAYYNTKRSEGSSLMSIDTRINTMFESLVRAGFHVRTRWITVNNANASNVPTSSGEPSRVQQLEQLFFCTDTQIALARRFVSSTAMMTDSTFKTNDLKMPLATTVGVTNTGLTFPFSLSFVRSESQAAFSFIFACVSSLRVALLDLLQITH